MASTAELAIRISARDMAQSVLQGMIAPLRGIASAATAPTRALGGLTDVLGRVGLAGLGVKALAEGIGGIATGMVGGNAEMETYTTQLGTLLGSADAAKERLAELAKFGAETPFELPEVVRAEKVLLGFGLTGQRAIEMTGKSATGLRTIIGDIAAGTGASFEEIALNFGKFSAGATGEAISRFQEMGIVTREQLAAMGIEFSKSGELVSPLPEAMAAAVKIAEGKFGGGMGKLSQTFSGQMSTLADNFNQVKIAVMAPIFDVLKDSVAGMNEVLSGEGFQGALQNVANLMAGAVSNGVRIAKDLFEAARGVFLAFTVDAGGMGITMDALRRIFGDTVANAIQPFVHAFMEAIPSIKAFVSDALVGLSNALGTATGFLAALAPTGERIARLFEWLTSSVSGLLPHFSDIAAQAVVNQDTLSGLADVVNRASEAIEEVAGFVADNLKPVLIGLSASIAAVVIPAFVAWGVSAAAAAAATIVAMAPVVAAVAAIGVAAGLLVAAWEGNWGDIQGVTASVVSFITGAFETVKLSVSSAIETVRSVLDGFISTVRGVVDAIGGLLNAIGRIPSSIGLPSLPNISLPGFQHGGAFTVGGSGGVDSRVVAFRATPGERVAVSPGGEGGLSYDRLAAALASQPIIIQMDGREVGRLVRMGLLRDSQASIGVGLS